VLEVILHVTALVGAVFADDCDTDGKDCSVRDQEVRDRPKTARLA
jgi:hypothetical protein